MLDPSKKSSRPTLQSRVLKIDQKFQLREMAHAKKVNFHILSQIVVPADFGPGVTAGKEQAPGAAAITVEKHKIDFKAQYGTFSDKPSENITRYMEKAEKYQKAHMIPSLEMASVVISCIKGEPATKIQRMLTAPGEDYENADHFAEQEEQLAVKYTPYKPRVEAKKRSQK